MRLAKVPEAFPFRLGVRIDATVSILSASSDTIPGFCYTNYTAPANKKKDAPLRGHEGRIGTLAEMRQSAHGV